MPDPLLARKSTSTGRQAMARKSREIPSSQGKRYSSVPRGQPGKGPTPTGLVYASQAEPGDAQRTSQRNQGP